MESTSELIEQLRYATKLEDEGPTYLLHKEEAHNSCEHPRCATKSGTLEKGKTLN